MNLLDLSLDTPEHNLACDEALLELCEAGRMDECLRFWEPSGDFVVLGYANRAHQEVNLPACQARNLPVLRRCSGGGAVVQGPGCLNYSLILRMQSEDQVRGITATNDRIMTRHREALEALLRQPVSVQGCTDLALGDRKFSGNSQRRKQACLLFHGTFLLSLDLVLMEQVLPGPTRQPDYRRQRLHRDFVVKLGLPAESVKQALARIWRAETPLPIVPWAEIDSLVQNKYSRAEWNLKFL